MRPQLLLLLQRCCAFLGNDALSCPPPHARFRANIFLCEINFTYLFRCRPLAKKKKKKPSDCSSVNMCQPEKLEGIVDLLCNRHTRWRSETVSMATASSWHLWRPLFAASAAGILRRNVLIAPASLRRKEPESWQWCFFFFWMREFNLGRWRTRWREIITLQQI